MKSFTFAYSMAISKKFLFSEKELQVSKICKALGHPARIAILKHLIQKNNQTCQQIVDKLPLSQSTVSQHLKELRVAGLINGKNIRTSVEYSVDNEALLKAQRMLSDVFFPEKPGTRQAKLF